MRSIMDLRHCACSSISIQTLLVFWVAFVLLTSFFIYSFLTSKLVARSKVTSFHLLPLPLYHQRYSPEEGFKLFPKDSLDVEEEEELRDFYYEALTAILIVYVESFEGRSCRAVTLPPFDLGILSSKMRGSLTALEKASILYAQGHREKPKWRTLHDLLFVDPKFDALLHPWFTLQVLFGLRSCTSTFTYSNTFKSTA